MADWWQGQGESAGPSEAELQARGWRIEGNEDNARWVPPPGWRPSDNSTMGYAPPPEPPPPPPAPTPWEVQGQHVVLDSKNTNWYFNGWRYFADMRFNGQEVIYIPREFAEQGLKVGNTSYWAPWMADEEVQQYMKPVVLDKSVVDESKRQKGMSTGIWDSGIYSSPYQGIIIPTDKVKEAIARHGDAWVWQQEAPKKRGGVYGVAQDIAQFVNDIPAIGKVAIALSSPYGAAALAAFNATQALMQGDIGRAAIAALPLVLPGAEGSPPVVTIPGVDNAVNALSEGLNVSTESAGKILQGTIEAAASGGDIKQILKGFAASYLGEQAGDFVSGFAKNYPLDGLQKLAKSVTSASTKAFLYNQDVSKAAISAFATEAVPLAFNQIPGYTAWAKANPNLAAAARTTAIEAAKGGDIGQALRLAAEQTAVRVFAPTVESALKKQGIAIGDAQRQLISDSLMAAVQGKPIDSALQQYAVNQARTVISDQVAKTQGWETDSQKQAAVKQYGTKVTPTQYYDKTAKSEGWEDNAAKQAALSEYGPNITPADYSAKKMGWESYDQKLDAQKQYGSAIKPDDYVARQQGWEDVSAKKAAINAYGDTITPAGFKEREQVKSIDPSFNAEAYVKLNEVSGDPYQHFLSQGQKTNLPTTYEKGAEAALKSIGYQPDQNDITQVADLFKKSTNPDVALQQYYDQHWVTPEEAAETAKQAGFELTPQQLSKFTGQAKGGQDAVFEDIGTAAKIGQESQRQRSEMVDKYVSDITNTYKNQGYSDAQIAAAISQIKSKIGNAFDDNVKQLEAASKEALANFGPDSEQYKAARIKVLDAQSTYGGYGLVKESGGYKSSSGFYTPSSDVNAQSTWASNSLPKSQFENVLAQVFQTAMPFGAPIAGYLLKEVRDAVQSYVEGNKTALDAHPELKSNIDDWIKSATGKDVLRIFGGTQAPSAATEAIRKEFAVIGVPGQEAPVYSPEGAQKSAIIGEVPSGAGDGKVPTLFGMPLSSSFVDFGSNLWVRLDKDTWVTPDNKYSFVSLPGGGEVRDLKTQLIVTRLTPQQTTQVTPKPPATPPVPSPTAPPSVPESPIEKTVQDIKKAADEGRISQEEAAKAIQEEFAKAGYTGTPEEIQQQSGQMQGEKTAEQLKKEIGAYIDPRMVTEEEVRKAYQDAGLQQPTEEDVKRFTGQRPQAELPGQISTYLPTASANVLTSTSKQISDFTVRVDELMQQGQSYQAATNQALAELRGAQSQIGQQQQQTQAQIGQMQTQFSQRVDDLMKQGQSYQAATDQALAELRGGQTQLSQQQQQTQAQIGQVQTQFNQRVDQLIAQGQSYQAATNQALNELTAGQGRLGETIAGVKTGLEGQISGLGEGLGTAISGLGQQFAQQQQAALAAQQQNKFQNLLAQFTAVPASGMVQQAAIKAPLTLQTKAKTGKFEGPLDQFLAQVESGSYAQPTASPQQKQPQPVEPSTMPQNFFSYGQQPEIDENLGFGQIAFASGGLAAPLMAAKGGLPSKVVHHSGKMRMDFRDGAHVSGPGDGQSDDIPAMLADGEFVFPADVVSALGNGSTKAGSDKLYEMMHEIRNRARSAHAKDLPPPAKSPLEYLKDSRKSRR